MLLGVGGGVGMEKLNGALSGENFGREEALMRTKDTPKTDILFLSWLGSDLEIFWKSW